MYGRADYDASLFYQMSAGVMRQATKRAPLLLFTVADDYSIVYAAVRYKLYKLIMTNIKILSK